MIQQSFAGHMTIFDHVACVTAAGQRSLTAGLLKMGLSDSGWLKIKCNNSIGRGRGSWIIRSGGKDIAINLIGGVEGINSIGRGYQSRKNEDFQLPDWPYIQAPNQGKLFPLLCVYFAPTRHYSIPRQINTCWHLYSVKKRSKSDSNSIQMFTAMETSIFSH